MRSSNVMIAYEEIKDKIFRRELMPGDSLIELKLAEELDMSRTPIRKAIDMLIEEGLVGRIPSKSTYVKSTVRNELIMAYELSEALDGMAAYLVAEQVANGTVCNGEMSVLRQLSGNLVDCLMKKNTKKWAEIDKLFHVTIVIMSGNELIVRANQENYKHINELLWFRVVQDFDKEASNRMHLDLITAISAGDKEKSRKIAQEHRRRVIQAI